MPQTSSQRAHAKAGVSYPVMVPPTNEPKVFKHASMQFSNTPDAVLPVARCDGDGATAAATGLEAGKHVTTRYIL